MEDSLGFENEIKSKYMEIMGGYGQYQNQGLTQEEVDKIKEVDD